MIIPSKHYKPAFLGKSILTFLMVVFPLLAFSETAFADTLLFSTSNLILAPAGGKQILYVSLQALGQAPAGGLLVLLASTDTSVAQVQQSVTIPAGANGAGFYVTGASPGTATILGFNPNFPLLSTNVTVNAVLTAPTLTFSPANLTLASGTQQTMNVILSTPAPAGGLTVLLASTNTFLAQVPNSILIPANATGAGFFVTGSSPGLVNILGFNPNFPLLSANVLVTPPPTGGSISFSPSNLSVPTGGRQLLFVNLPPLTQAPAGGLIVALGSNNPFVAGVPPTVTIPAGANGAGFFVTGFGPGSAMIGAFAPPNYGPIFTAITVN